VQPYYTVEIAPDATETLETPPSPRATRRLRRIGLPRPLAVILSDRKAAAGVGILAFFIVIAVVGPLIWRGDPLASDYTAVPQQPPSAAHWFGTDQQSHDIFLQMVDGTRPTLFFGAAIGVCATALSIVVGVSAGYFGGWVDEILSLIMNIFLVIPSLPAMIVLGSWIHTRSDWPVIAVISAFGWAGTARVLRSQALSLRQRDFVVAAVVIGESGWRITLGEVMPNMISLVAHGFIGAVMGGIGAAAGLQFLGIGNLAEVNWFTILYWAQNAAALQTGAWWTFVIPGCAIALVGLSCALINYGIDEISNPRLRTERTTPPRAKAQRIPAPTPSKAAS